MTYSFRELSAREYDDILKLATKPDDESADLSTVLRLMALRSISPSFDADAFMDLPYPVYSKLLGVINKMHFGLDDEAKEETPPNGSEPTSSSTSS